MAEGAQTSGVRPEFPAGCISYNNWWKWNVLSAFRSRAQLSSGSDLLSFGLPALITGLQCQAPLCSHILLQLSVPFKQRPRKAFLAAEVWAVSSQGQDDLHLSVWRNQLKYPNFNAFGLKRTVRLFCMPLMHCGKGLLKGSVLYLAVLCGFEGCLHVWLDCEEHKQVGICFGAPSDYSAPWRWNQF